MKIDKAINVLEYMAADIYGYLLGLSDKSVAKTLWQRIDAIDTALIALIEKQAVNDPLTADELREMDGEPVWMEFRGKPKVNEWCIVNWDCQMGAIRLWDNTGMWWRFNPFKMTVYRRKPERSVE